MRTGSLRLRVMAAVLGLMAVALVTFGTIVTLAYRKSREDDLQRRLKSGASAMREAWPGGAAKGVIGALNLEGISVTLRQPGETRPVTLPPSGKKQFGPVKDARPSIVVEHVDLGDGASATLTASAYGIDQDVQGLVLLEALIGAGILLVGALAVHHVTRVALRPLDHVAAVAEGIAAGDTDRRLHPRRPDTELGRMAAAFDRMVDALQDALERSRAAEASTRRFLADAAHELRTPVATVQATAETLLRQQPGRPERDALEARLAGDAARLGRLIADLLDLARLDGAPEAAAAPVDLRSIAGEALDQAGPERGRVDVDVDGEPAVHGDARALARVVRNLLDNALAATAPGGRVRLSVDGSAAEARIRVVDDGPGVPPSERERIFERFVRLDASGRPGSGLGLAIARAIARQHGGDLRCDRVERGASFTLVLPAS